MFNFKILRRVERRVSPYVSAHVIVIAVQFVLTLRTPQRVYATKAFEEMVLNALTLTNVKKELTIVHQLKNVLIDRVTTSVHVSRDMSQTEKRASTLMNVQETQPLAPLMLRALILMDHMIVCVIPGSLGIELTAKTSMNVKVENITAQNMQTVRTL